MYNFNNWNLLKHKRSKFTKNFLKNKSVNFQIDNRLI